MDNSAGRDRVMGLMLLRETKYRQK